MNCELSHTILHGYFDGELDAARAAEFEKHLETCRDCDAALAAAESLRSELRRGQFYERAPDSSRESLNARLSGKSSVSPIPTVRDWKWLAAASILLAAALAWIAFSYHRAGTSAFGEVKTAELIDAHVRSLQPGHLMDVQSTDQHTVKPWFDGKLDFVPPVADFSDEGFPLMGGRLDVLGGQSVAVLVYGRRKHIINVFVWPTKEADIRPQSSATYQGYQWVHWRHQGLEFYAISDVSSADLKDLGQLFLH